MARPYVTTNAYEEVTSIINPQRLANVAIEACNQTSRHLPRNPASSVERELRILSSRSPREQ